MNMRPLGSTGLKVGEIGLGCWQLGNPIWDMGDPALAQDIVRESLDHGGNFFDTAPGYAEGRSEEILGQAVQPVRDRVVLCSKFGHKADGTVDFSVAALRPALEASLRRLRTDYLDVYLLHNPPVELHDGTSSPLQDELERLKAEGKIRSYGISLDTRRDLETVIEKTRCQAVEVLFNIFHQEPRAAFARARERGIGLIVKVPLDSGWLTGRYRENSVFSGIRHRWSREVIMRRAVLVERLTALLPPGVPLARAALQYILAQPEVSTVIPGAKSIAQVRDNFAAANEEPLPPEIIDTLRAFWQRELENNPLPW